MVAVPPSKTFPVRGADPIQRTGVTRPHKRPDSFTPLQKQPAKPHTDQTQPARPGPLKQTPGQKDVLGNGGKPGETRQVFTLQTLSTIAGVLVGQLEQAEGPLTNGESSVPSGNERSPADSENAQAEGERPSPVRPGSQIDFSA